uniref:Acyl_transf_3 domain-containing protein n=1 Tax=Ascaris lumbricoides TaxID=6252 RepID=A0A0M3ISQ6_ASCLU
VEPFLFAHDTIPQQREFFVGSYASGDVQGYASKHRSRWVEPFLFAHDTIPQQREFFVGSYASGDVQGYASKHRSRWLLNSWIEYISGSTNIAVDEVECVRSRYEKQWFETLVPLIEFSSNKLLMWIVAFATVYHLQRGEQTNSLLMRLFLAFSVKKNFIAITTLPKDSQSTIGCIFGLRFLITVWVIVGHSSIFIQDFLSNPEIYRRQLTDNFFGQLVTNCMLSVDTFFVLSATLTSFHWFRSISRAGAQQKLTSLGYWLRFYRHRVLRLWPAYLYVLLVTVLRFSRSHFHPMWAPEDQGEMCRKNWWKNALFINSFSDNLCMPWT